MTINKIRWERDDANESGFVSPVENDRVILFGAADNLVKSLMYEVQTISANFNQDDLVVFGRMLQVSIFDNVNAEFYGLYASSNSEATDLPNFCLRQVCWKRNYRTLENVLTGLKATTKFFNSNKLTNDEKSVIQSIDCPIKTDCEIVYTPTSNNFFSNKKMQYYFDNCGIGLTCTDLQTSAAHNVFMENSYTKLYQLFTQISQRDTVKPLSGTFRISYISNYLNAIFN